MKGCNSAEKFYIILMRGKIIEVKNGGLNENQNFIFGIGFSVPMYSISAEGEV